MAASLQTRVELMFGGRCNRAPQGVAYAPGRIVLLGEHLDHQGGRVLATPTPEGVACAWAVRPDSRVVVWGMNARQKDSFQQGQAVKSGRSWADLARGACAHVARGERRLPGIDLMVLGDLPMGEGLASSAAYLVVLLRALYESIGEYRSKWELAEDIPQIEREWVGVHCGPLDPYIVAAAKPGQVLDLDCRELDHSVLHLPEDTDLVAEDTGLQRLLSDTPYNVRVAELTQALKDVRAACVEPGQEALASLVDLSPEAFEALEDQLPEPSRARTRHVVTESARVADAAAAILAGDMERLGRLMTQGHLSLTRDFDSSLPEIDALVEKLVARPEVLGARMQGAGWGGRIAVLRRR